MCCVACPADDHGLVRIRGQFMQTNTSTGRLAMEEPSLQTIPRPVEYELAATQSTQGNSQGGPLALTPRAAAAAAAARRASGVGTLPGGAAAAAGSGGTMQVNTADRGYAVFAFLL